MLEEFVVFKEVLELRAHESAYMSMVNKISGAEYAPEIFVAFFSSYKTQTEFYLIFIVLRVNFG